VEKLQILLFVAIEYHVFKNQTIANIIEHFLGQLFAVPVAASVEKEEIVLFIEVLIFLIGICCLGLDVRFIQHDI
jgi:hypothetical protein